MDGIEKGLADNAGGEEGHEWPREPDDDGMMGQMNNACWSSQGSLIVENNLRWEETP